MLSDVLSRSLNRIQSLAFTKETVEQWLNFLGVAPYLLIRLRILYTSILLNLLYQWMIRAKKTHLLQRWLYVSNSATWSWFNINKVLATTFQGQFPELNAQQINMVLQHLLGNYAYLESVR